MTIKSCKASCTTSQQCVRRSHSKKDLRQIKEAAHPYRHWYSMLLARFARITSEALYLGGGDKPFGTPARHAAERHQMRPIQSFGSKHSFRRQPARSIPASQKVAAAGTPARQSISSLSVHLCDSQFHHSRYICAIVNFITCLSEQALLLFIFMLTEHT